MSPHLVKSLEFKELLNTQRGGVADFLHLINLDFIRSYLQLNVGTWLCFWKIAWDFLKRVFDKAGLLLVKHELIFGSEYLLFFGNSFLEILLTHKIK